METTGDEELRKRVEDLQAIRGLLSLSTDIPVLHWWVFIVWAVLVGGGTLIHFMLYRSTAMAAKTALVWIWLPILILGAVVESISFALMADREKLPLFNRRFGGAMLGSIASLVVITVVAIHLANVGLTPGIIILLCSLPVAFYAQISYAGLFIETFGGIAVGLLFEFAGAHGDLAFLASGVFAAIEYAVAGAHLRLFQRQRRA
ncbi:MAG TPA: hypothetical protein VMX33_03935 [bacterium]|nr:hypothetical protein [bacterium]